jgi:hypothetical protein
MGYGVDREQSNIKRFSLMTTANEVGSKLSTHEAVCAERYTSINARLRRLEGILLAAAGSIIVALGAIAWQVAQS